jgi:stress response protein YsnF
MDGNSRILIPVVEEKVHIVKRIVDDDRIFIQKRSETDTVQIDESLRTETVEIERIAKNTPLDHMPKVRIEGDTIVIPVVEEIIETKKSLLLKEEIHVRKKAEQKSESIRAEVRREVVDIERTPSQDPADDG